MFQFEADFVDSLRCIPMQVRLKLDTCGIKLKLNEWHHISQAQRQMLVDLPCETAMEVQAYRQFLSNLVWESTGHQATDLAVETSPAWCDRTIIPHSVQAKAESFSISLSTEQWANLSSLERFALIKLSLSDHENINFVPALTEFRLI